MARKNPPRGTSTPPKTPLAPTTTGLNKKLDELKESIVMLTAELGRTEERIMQKFGELSAETANLKSSVAAMEKRVSAVENACADTLLLRNELIAAENQINALEANAVATDLIITGVPQTANECLPELMAKICRTVEHKAPPLCDAFRVRSRGSSNTKLKPNNSPPIVIKLFSAPDRNQLLKSVSAFCKTKQRSLALSDIDLPGYGSIHVNESLPRKLREVMTHASMLRRQKKLVSAYSIRGRVYVRRKSGEDAKLVNSVAEVDAVIGV